MKKLFLLLFISTFSFAQNENRKFESFKKGNNSLEIKTSDGLYILKLYSEKIAEICNKLIGYRFVDEIHEIHKGKHVRWIRNTTQKLTNGGIVMDIKFLDNGTQILCMNSMHRFNQYKFDECLTFQKLSIEEQLILMAYDYMTNSA